MSANPELEGIVALPVPTAPAPAPEAPSEEVVAPTAQEGGAPEAAASSPRRVRPAWFATAIVGAAALLASGALGYDAYAASRQRDDLYGRLVSTSATLASTQNQLSAAQADARSKKVTADYVSMYVADVGRVDTDYQALATCDSFGSCRTDSQQLLEDLQRFQSDRQAATVPGAVSASDASLGDALSAAIAADEELISGMDAGDVDKFQDGFHKLDAAMLNVGKAEASLGAELK